MDEEQAFLAYEEVKDLLNEIIESGQRGSRQDLLDELDNDLE